ncbi:MAG: permease-like cell division protein FtsX [Lachnospiraceae bacterium]|nr:permease-like cell division protein FtsX [Lachnospiraceae bacterium]
MPPEVAISLLENCTQPFRYSRFSRVCAVLAAIFCIGVAGSTSLAAYNIYQEKQLMIFMDADLTTEEINVLGDELIRLTDITSCHYVSSDEAWKYFADTYLNNELASAFTDNPLANSFNYQVSIRMGADTEAVRERIARLDGVRKITTVREWEKSQKESASN